jgi:exonuclease VII small subunit
MSQPTEPTPEPNKPSRLSAAVEALTNHKNTVAALKSAREEVVRVTATLATTQADLETATTSLESAIAERDTAQTELSAARDRIAELEAEAAKVPGLQAELTTAQAEVAKLTGEAKTVTQVVTAELETLGVTAEALPGTTRTETVDKGTALLTKFNAAKSGAEKIAIIREAKAAGIKLSDLEAKSKQSLN